MFLPYGQILGKNNLGGGGVLALSVPLVPLDGDGGGGGRGGAGGHAPVQLTQAGQAQGKMGCGRRREGVEQGGRIGGEVPVGVVVRGEAGMTG